VGLSLVPLSSSEDSPRSGQFLGGEGGCNQVAENLKREESVFVEHLPLKADTCFRGSVHVAPCGIDLGAGDLPRRCGGLCLESHVPMKWGGLSLCGFVAGSSLRPNTDWAERCAPSARENGEAGATPLRRRLARFRLPDGSGWCCESGCAGRSARNRRRSRPEGALFLTDPSGNGGPGSDWLMA